MAWRWHWLPSDVSPGKSTILATTRQRATQILPMLDLSAHETNKRSHSSKQQAMKHKHAIDHTKVRFKPNANNKEIPED
jgi:hypothetical protein